MTTLADTSILLRLPNTDDAHYQATLEALEILWQRHELVVVARQNFVEFRGSASRPTKVNGLGMSPSEADEELNRLETLFPQLSDQNVVYDHWRRLCRAAGVSGKQVHDTRLVAVCVASGVQTILTWNPDDFRRFIPFVPGLTVWTPADIILEDDVVVVKA